MKLACVLFVVLQLFVLSAQPHHAQTSGTNRTETQVFEGFLSNDSPSVSFDFSVRRSNSALRITLTDGFDAEVALVAPETRRTPEVTLTRGISQLTHTIASYGDYRLDIQQLEGDPASGEFEVVVFIEELPIEADLIGLIDDDNVYHSFPIRVSQTGTGIEIDLRETTAGLDTKLYLVDENTSLIIAANDDRDRLNGDKSSYIFYPQAAAGDYRVIATRYNEERGSTTGEFRLFVNLTPPSLLASSASTFGFVGLDGRVNLNQLISGFPNPANFEPREHTAWTIFAYYGGDNDLEAALIADMREFEVAGSNENVRVVVLLDRSPGYDDSNDDWQGARLFEIGPADTDAILNQLEDEPFPPTLITPKLSDLGTVNSGQGELLAQYLVWGINNYPSDNYVVALGSHGAGWQGIIADYTHDSIIPITEMQQAFNLALTQTELDKFAFLINDACFMSSVEYFEMVSDYFEYAIASPEIVVNPAHDMTLFMDQLNAAWQEPSFDTIGSELVAKYINVDILVRPGSDVNFLTSAVTDLKEFNAVTQAVEEFAAIINDRNPLLVGSLLGAARENAYTYQDFMRSRNSPTANRMIDLSDFMRRVIEIAGRNYGDSEIVEAAQNVIDALDNVRVYAEGGIRVQDRIGYYNIYFPSRTDDFDVAYFDQSPLKEWGRMLRNYYTVVTPAPWEGDSVFHTPTSPRLNMLYEYPADNVNVANSLIVEVEIIGRNIAQGFNIFDRVEPDGTVVRYAQEQIFVITTRDGQLEFTNSWESGYESAVINWDVALPVLSDGVNANFEMLSIGSESLSMDARYCSPNVICEQDSDWNTVTIGFNRGLEGGDVQRVISHTQNGGGVIEIPEGSTLETYRYVVTADGQTQPQPGNRYVWPEEGLTWTWQPAPDGEYEIGLEIVAFGGTTGYQTVSVTVAGNDDLPENLRARLRPPGGYIFPYLSDWNEPPTDVFDLEIISEGLGRREVSGRPDGTLRASVNAYLIGFFLEDTDAIPDETMIEWAETDLNLEILTEPRLTTVAGQRALEFDIRTTEGDQQYVGRAFIVLVRDETQIGLVVTVEASGGTDFADAYDLIKAHFGFINPYDFIDLTEANRQWMQWPPAFAQIETADALQDRMQFPHPIEWDVEIVEDRAFALRAMPETADRRQFFATDIFNITGVVEGEPRILTHALIGYALEGAEQLTLTNTHTLYGQYHRWQAVSYTVRRDGVLLTGRIYTSPTQDRTIAAWFETPMIETEDGFIEDIETIRAIFEPIIDGYRIFEAEDDANATN